VPCAGLFLLIPFPAAWIFIFLAVFFLFLNTGPTNTILANVTHPAIRSAGFALNILVIHLLGDAISPAVTGAIAGLTTMETAFLLVAVLMEVGAVLWFLGARYLERDTAAAPLRLP
jgi:MFS transporter, Spinster family, sphingosine-1-phosphate transporter